MDSLKKQLEDAKRDECEARACLKNATNDYWRLIWHKAIDSIESDIFRLEAAIRARE